MDEEFYINPSGGIITIEDMECDTVYIEPSTGEEVTLNSDRCDPGILDPTQTMNIGETMSGIFGIIGTVIGVIILLALIFNAVFIVRTNEVAVIERFGRYTRMAKAGINIKIPIVDRIANRMSLRVLQMDQSVSTITSDKVSVALNVSVQYRVSQSAIASETEANSNSSTTDPGGNLYRANYALTDVPSQITSYIYDAVRSTVPSKSLDDVFAEKDQIAQAVNIQLSATMLDYGYEIVRTLVTGVTPDSEVQSAMNSINAAERLKDAAKAQAEAYRIEIVGRATGEKEAKQLSGEGIAAQREAIANGLAKQHTILKEAGVVDPEQTMLANQYFDSMVSVADKSNATTVFLPGGADGAGQLMGQIRNSLLTASAAAHPAAATPVAAHKQAIETSPSKS